jgi:hypothetical protein
MPNIDQRLSNLEKATQPQGGDNCITELIVYYEDALTGVSRKHERFLLGRPGMLWEPNPPRVHEFWNPTTNAWQADPLPYPD